MKNRIATYRNLRASSLRLAVLFLLLCAAPAAAQDVKVLPPTPQILPPVPTPGVPAAQQRRYEVPQEGILAPTVVEAPATADARPAVSADSAIFLNARADSASVAPGIDARSLFPTAQTVTPGQGPLAPTPVLSSNQIRVYFPTGDAVLRNSYMSNETNLDVLDILLNEVSDNIDSVLVVSQASPEGDVTRNMTLAEERAYSMRRHIIATNPDLLSRIYLYPIGEGWSELRSAILADPQLDFASRTRLLSIIDATAPVEAKKAQLRAQPEYSHLLRDIFPTLRLSAVDFRFNTGRTPQIAEVQPQAPGLVVLPLIIPVEDLPITLPQSSIVLDPLALRVRPLPMPSARKENLLFAVKTNLLYDAVTMLNAEVEIPFLYRFSLLWEDVFPWWETGNKYCLQHWEMGPELRFWFRSWRPGSMDKMLGWFVGAYGMSSRYDIQFDTKIDYQGEYWSAGLTAGYVMPFKKGWLHDALRARLEFSLSAGYLQTDYRHYLPTDSYDMLIRDKYNDGTATYIGPTKAKVSLVVPIRTQIRERR